MPEKTKETTQTIRHALNEQITALKDLVSVIQKNDQKNVKEQLIPTISSSSTLNKPDIASPEVIKKIVPPKPILQQDQSKKGKINGYQIF